MKRLALTALFGLSFSASAQAAMPPLKLPDGFRATLYASGFQRPRLMVLAPNGDVILSETGAGQVIVLSDGGRVRSVYAGGLNTPHGLALHGGYLYVAQTNAVVRYPYRTGDRRASGPAQKVVDLPDGGEHVTRTLTFGPDGRMYVSVGSSCNVCNEQDKRRAAVMSYAADGRDARLYASGLRNAVGLAWHRGALYVSNNGRDYLGDTTPPEAFYKLRPGGFYGWPTCFTVAGRQVADPAYPKATCKNALPPFATVDAHSAPMDLTFYDARLFPAAYQGQIIAALHGSSIRKTPSGNMVVTINPRTGQVKPLITGFLAGMTKRGGVSNYRYRPVGLLVLQDGSLLVTDDTAGNIYRVTYGR